MLLAGREELMSQKEPMDIINEETITVSLNAEEALVLMKAVAVAASFLPDGHQDVRTLMTLMDKLGPGIEEKAKKQMRIMRDQMN
jgi:hypothetical protein